MGTNYYARRIPKREDKEYLKKLIDEDNFFEIKQKVAYMYGNFELDGNEPSGGVYHLGKRSIGWKFLWNPNIYRIRNWHKDKHGEYVSDPDTPYYVYPLTKDGIKDFIDSPDLEIYDEYDEKQDKREFFRMALDWVTWKDYKTSEITEAWDSDTYKREHPNESHYSCDNNYTRFLESLGYKLSELKHDFYSDGLRFSTTTDFS